MTAASGCGWTLIKGDCTEIMRSMPDKSVSVCLSDPPYSRVIHASVRSSGRRDLPDVKDFGCRTRRAVDLGFEHLTPNVRRACAREWARLSKRWVMAFSDIESCAWWRLSMEAAGLIYRRTCEWIRIGGAPQFHGRCPAAGTETITCAHPPGAFRWNGGGKTGLYESVVVANRLGARGERIHKTQKPLQLMMDLVTDFTDHGDVVLDAFAGSGTTGVACMRLGRRFLGIEKDPEYFALAVKRLRAEEDGTTLAAARAGQMSLLGGRTKT